MLDFDKVVDWLFFGPAPITAVRSPRKKALLACALWREFLREGREEDVDVVDGNRVIALVEGADGCVGAAKGHVSIDVDYPKDMSYSPEWLPWRATRPQGVDVENVVRNYAHEKRWRSTSAMGLVGKHVEKRNERVRNAARLVVNVMSPSPEVRLPKNTDAVRLAIACYDHRPNGRIEPDRLAVLSDCLEELGQEGLAVALREPGTHYMGHWALDAILGTATKEVASDTIRIAWAPEENQWVPNCTG